MLQLVERASEKSTLQKLLMSKIYDNFECIGVSNIGYPSNNANEIMYVRKESGTWAAFSDVKDVAVPRRWNAFGKYNPKASSQTIVVEINININSNSSIISGAFGKDIDGNIYLLHTGRVGGGTKGVGKNSFLAWSDLLPTKVIDSKLKYRNYIVIAKLDSKTFIQELEYFINKVHKYKQFIRDGGTTSDSFKEKLSRFERYIEESHGNRSYRTNKFVEYNSIHGLVVDELRKHIESTDKYISVYNNKYIDIYTKIGNKIADIYEIKCSTERQSIYTAVGQLKIHSTSMPNFRKLILVVPDDDFPDGIVPSLPKLNIEILKYRATESGIKFI